jgi:signal transduction histidine kinase
VLLSFEMPDQDIMMLSDEGKLSQILRNFISNALKFTEAGSVTVRAEPGRNGGEMRFSVADTGLGIAEQDQKRIFEEFGQVENRLQHRIKGTGLGLPLCRNLANLLSGTVTLQSEPGKGSIFSVIIPCQNRDASAADNALITGETEGRVEHDNHANAHTDTTRGMT